MRAPSDLPRRRPRPPRARVSLVIVASILFVLLLSLRGIAGFYTDYLWFDSLDLSRVWRGVLGAKAALVVIFTAIFFALAWLNLAIADRIAPRFRPAGPEEELAERYRELVGERTGLVRLGTAFVLALVAGIPTSAQWHSWLLFRNRVSFGTKDAQFNEDVGFYVFSLPFLKFVVDWAFAALVIILIITTIAHYLNGGIRIQTPEIQRVTPQVKGHLSVLLGALALLKAFGYYLQRYELTTSTRGFVDGASYTEVRAQLPALKLLVIISAAAFVLFIVNIWMRGWVLPVIAVGLWAFTSVIIGAAYPAFVQKFRVEPNQPVREREYIKRNIAATRTAMRIDGVKVNDFAYNENLTAADLEDNRATIRNVRLWDPNVLQATYAQQQEIRKFYRFNDVDVDRYPIGDQMTQVMISARELDSGGVPATWANTHLNFTHGYGAVASPANAVTKDGLPDYLLRDLPPETRKGGPRLNKQPAVYFGEDLGGYAIVRTKQKETDYQTDKGTVRTTYSGTGGVRLSSYLRRVAFALRFGDVNPLISNLVTSNSRAIYIRDIRERVEKAAPFLRYDADPYPVVLEGRIFWVQDAYTTTNRYPYAQRVSTERLDARSGLRIKFNYVRNSVKVLIDAYNGTLRFYIVDRKDPIAAAYAKAFPELFEPGSVPSDLRPHLRYPEDLFRVQTNTLTRYHITDPAGFYDAGDAWDIARDPSSGPISGSDNQTTPVGTAVGATGSVDTRMEPYYLLTRLPGEKKESFLILQPFTPASRPLLSAFVVAKSDPDNYGQLEAFVMPRSQAVSGPTQVDAKINQDTEISKTISLLGRTGSQVRQGNLLVIPINRSLLYIRPLYVVAEKNPVPELKLVVVVFGDRAVARPTLQEALTALFGAAPQTLEQAPGTSSGGGTTPPPTGGVTPTVQSLLDQALAAYQAAQTALKAGDLAEYQRQVNAMNGFVERAHQASGGSPTTTTPPASA